MNRFFEVTIHAHKYISTYPCEAENIVTACAREYEFFNDVNVVMMNLKRHLLQLEPQKKLNVRIF